MKQRAKGNGTAITWAKRKVEVSRRTTWSLVFNLNFSVDLKIRTMFFLGWTQLGPSFGKHEPQIEGRWHFSYWTVILVLVAQFWSLFPWSYLEQNINCHCFQHYKRERWSLVTAKQENKIHPTAWNFLKWVLDYPYGKMDFWKWVTCMVPYCQGSRSLASYRPTWQIKGVSYGGQK